MLRNSGHLGQGVSSTGTRGPGVRRGSREAQQLDIASTLDLLLIAVGRDGDDFTCHQHTVDVTQHHHGGLSVDPDRSSAATRGTFISLFSTLC